MIVVVMGPSGAGKSTIGRALGDALGWDFVDADDLHPAANVDKMRRGQPLDDADRAPWLDRVAAAIDARRARGQDLVVACSALRQAYRDRLAPARFVLLTAPPEVLAERLRARRGHFFPPSLLASQLDTLEPPRDAAAVDATRPVADVVAAIRRALAI